MREKLISVCETACGDARDAIAQALRDLRCDTCKRWSGPGALTPNEGRCELLTYESDYPLARVSGDAYFKCPSDFFCAYWEPK